MRDSGISSGEGSNSTADGRSYSSLGDKASTSLEEMPDVLRDDIANSTQLLQVALQVSDSCLKNLTCQVSFYKALCRVRFFFFGGGGGGEGEGCQRVPLHIL